MEIQAQTEHSFDITYKDETVCVDAKNFEDLKEGIADSFDLDIGLLVIKSVSAGKEYAMKTQRIYESYVKKGGNNGVFEIKVSLAEPAQATEP